MLNKALKPSQARDLMKRHGFNVNAAAAELMEKGPQQPVTATSQPGLAIDPPPSPMGSIAAGAAKPTYGPAAPRLEPPGFGGMLRRGLGIESQPRRFNDTTGRWDEVSLAQQERERKGSLPWAMELADRIMAGNPNYRRDEVKYSLQRIMADPRARRERFTFDEGRVAPDESAHLDESDVLAVVQRFTGIPGNEEQQERLNVAESVFQRAGAGSRSILKRTAREDAYKGNLAAQLKRGSLGLFGVVDVANPRVQDAWEQFQSLPPSASNAERLRALAAVGTHASLMEPPTANAPAIHHLVYGAMSAYNPAQAVGGALVMTDAAAGVLSGEMSVSDVVGTEPGATRAFALQMLGGIIAGLGVAKASAPGVGMRGAVRKAWFEIADDLNKGKLSLDEAVQSASNAGLIDPLRRTRKGAPPILQEEPRATKEGPLAEGGQPQHPQAEEGGVPPAASGSDLVEQGGAKPETPEVARTISPEDQARIDELREKLAMTEDPDSRRAIQEAIDELEEGTPEAPATPTAGPSTKVKWKKTADYAHTGTWEVDVDGVKRYVYWNKDTGWWVETTADNAPLPHGTDYRGGSRAEAIEHLRERPPPGSATKSKSTKKTKKAETPAAPEPETPTVETPTPVVQPKQESLLATPGTGRRATTEITNDIAEMLERKPGLEDTIHVNPQTNQWEPIPKLADVPDVQQYAGLRNELANAPRFEDTPSAPPAPKPKPTVPATPKPSAKLPAALEKGDPRYAYGDKQFTISFESDVDRAAYIAAQRKASKANEGYVQFAMEQTGWSREKVVAHGNMVKGELKKVAAGADAGDLHVGDMRGKGGVTRQGPRPGGTGKGGQFRTKKGSADVKTLAKVGAGLLGAGALAPYVADAIRDEDGNIDISRGLAAAGMAVLVGAGGRTVLRAAVPAFKGGVTGRGIVPDLSHFVDIVFRYYDEVGAKAGGPAADLAAMTRDAELGHVHRTAKGIDALAKGFENIAMNHNMGKWYRNPKFTAALEGLRDKLEKGEELDPLSKDIAELWQGIHEPIAKEAWERHVGVGVVLDKHNFGLVPEGGEVMLKQGGPKYRVVAKTDRPRSLTLEPVAGAMDDAEIVTLGAGDRLFRPVSKLGLEFFPRVFKQSVMDSLATNKNFKSRFAAQMIFLNPREFGMETSAKLWEALEGTPEAEQIIGNLMDEAYRAKNAAHKTAFERALGDVDKMVQGVDSEGIGAWMAGLEKERRLRFGKEYYETNLAIAAPKYLDRAHKRLAIAEAFGSGATDVIENALHEVGKQDEWMKSYYETTIAAVLGLGDAPASMRFLENVSKAEGSYQTTTKLAFSGTTHIRQATDLLFGLVEAGEQATMRGVRNRAAQQLRKSKGRIGHHLADWLGGQDSELPHEAMVALQRGISGESTVRPHATPAEKASGWADTIYTYTGLRELDKHVKMTAIATGIADVRHTLSRLHAGPGKKLVRPDATLIRKLKRYGLDEADVVASRGNIEGYIARDDVAARIAGGIRRNFTYTGNRADLPMLLWSPASRMAFRFKAPMFQAGRFLLGSVFGEAAKGNFMPLARMAAYGTAFGELSAQAIDWIRGRDDRQTDRIIEMARKFVDTASSKGIEAAMSEFDIAKAASRFMKNFYEAGFMSWFGEFTTLNPGAIDRYGELNPLLPLTNPASVRSLQNVKEFIVGTLGLLAADAKQKDPQFTAKLAEAIVEPLQEEFIPLKRVIAHAPQLEPGLVRKTRLEAKERSFRTRGIPLPREDVAALAKLRIANPAPARVKSARKRQVTEELNRQGYTAEGRPLKQESSSRRSIRRRSR